MVSIFFSVDCIDIVLSLFPAEIVMLDGLTAVYRSNVDLLFYVVGSQTENEVIT